MVDRLSPSINSPLKAPVSPGAGSGVNRSAGEGADPVSAKEDDLTLTLNQRRKTATAMLQGESSLQQPVQNTQFATIQALPPYTSPPLAGASAVSPLASVRQSGQRITLNTILDDFNNTTQALGADDKTASEVKAYLNVVTLQGQSASPNVSLIQQSLSSAALSLDRFISSALGPTLDSPGAAVSAPALASNAAPAPIVQEWVDALLSQNIDYRLKPSASAEPFAASLSDAASSDIAYFGGSSPSEVSETAALAGQSIPPPTVIKQQLAETIRQTQQAASLGDWQTALQAVDTGLQQLDTAEADGQAFRPDLRGKLSMMRAGLLTRSGQPLQAVLTAYQQASVSFGEAGLPHKEAQALHAMATQVEQHAQKSDQPELLEYADTLYSEATQLNRATGNPQPLIDSLNDWASLRLNRGDAQGAIPLWTEAVKVSGKSASPGLSADLWHNLGQAQARMGQREQALSAFKNSLQHRFNEQDKAGYAATLNAMAQWIDESGRPGAANELRARATRLLSP